MLSPHTPPGTRVAFIKQPDTPIRYPEPVVGKVFILDHIWKDAETGFIWAHLRGLKAKGVCPSVLRRVDLPECLTSLLNVAPTDSGADKSITVED